MLLNDLVNHSLSSKMIEIDIEASSDKLQHVYSILGNLAFLKMVVKHASASALITSLTTILRFEKV